MTASVNSDSNLEHSRPIEFHCRCRNNLVAEVSGQFVMSMRHQYIAANGRSQNFRTQEHLNMMQRFIMDLHLSSLSDPTRWLAVPFDRSIYSANTRYSPKIGACSIATRIKDFLFENQYIELHGGFNDRRTGVGRRTRIRATQHLVGLLEQVHEFDYYKEGETVILKHPRASSRQPAALAEYVDTDSTNQMRHELARINQFIQDRWIDLRITDEEFRILRRQRLIELSNKRLKRIFNNNSFEQGGRFYGGWWIEIPKHYRPFITIDGSESVELDYSSMHLRILYAIENQPLPEGDLYTVNGFERNLVKSVFLRSINCTSRAQAVSSIINEIRENISKAETNLANSEDEMERTLAQTERDSIIDYSTGQIEDLLSRFTELHTVIERHLYSGIGLHLQFIDSKVANQTLLTLNDLGIVALPVHDSFIVKRSDEGQLRETMTSIFENVVNSTSQISRTIAPQLILESYDSFEEASAHFGESISSFSSYYSRSLYHESL